MTARGLGAGLSLPFPFFVLAEGLAAGGCFIAPGGYDGEWIGLYDNGGGARILGEYFQEFGVAETGDVGLALFACTVSLSTTNFSIRDSLLANSSAPFPLTAGISKAELPLTGVRTLAMGLMGEDDLSEMV